jgi:predicted kinase
MMDANEVENAAAADGDGQAGGGWRFPLCPAPPAWSLDWDGLVRQFDWLRALEPCQQDPAYHAEGSVLRHTRLVCEALIEMPAWRALEAEERSLLFAAALLHDVAKPLCTIERDGHPIAPGHAPRGALLAGYVLWRERSSSERPLAPLAIRTRIAALVRHHHLPVRLLDKPDPERALFAASQTARSDWLALLSEADVRGRICADQPDLLDRVELFREAAQELACWTMPRAFPSAHSRFRYFHAASASADYAAYDDTRFEVVVMAGLPGAGKSTWRETHLPGWPTIALDALRAELGIRPGRDQAPVIARAKALARGYMRAGRDFVWDATNTSRPMRDQLIAFFSEYGACVRIVYVEAAQSELLRRNRARSHPVPESVIEKLAQRLCVPDLTEAHRVEMVQT